MNLEKFTDRAKGFLQSAQTVAIRMNHQRITPLHLLKALLEDEEGMAAGLIQRAGGGGDFSAVEIFGSGHRGGDRQDVLGRGAPGDDRRDVFAFEGDDFVPRGIIV